jgi:hypothetical protein
MWNKMKQQRCLNKVREIHFFISCQPRRKLGERALCVVAVGGGCVHLRASNCVPSLRTPEITVDQAVWVKPSPVRWWVPQNPWSRWMEAPNTCPLDRSWTELNVVKCLFKVTLRFS